MLAPPATSHQPPKAQNSCQIRCHLPLKPACTFPSPPAMSTPQRSVPHAFTTALDRFRQGLIGDEIKTFNHLTCEKDVWDSIEELQKEQASRSALRNMARIEPFITGMAQYAKVIEVFVQAKPEIMALIWVRGHFQIPQISVLTGARGL